MQNPALLLSAIERRPIRDEPVARHELPWRRLVGALSPAVTLVAVPFMLRALWDGWQTGDWNGFWYWPAAMFQALAITLQVDRGVAKLIELRGKREQVQALRGRLARGDEEAATPAPSQPEPLTSAELQLGPAHFAPLKQAPTARGAVLSAIGASLVGLGIFCVIFALAFSSGVGRGGPPIAAISAAFAIAFGISGVWLLVVGIRQARSPVEVTADEWSVRWRIRSGREQVLAWHEARSFYQISYKTSLDWRPRVIYVLDALDRALLWQRESSPSRERQRESARLTRLIVARTHLSLCDVTDVLTAIEKGPSAATGQERNAEAMRLDIPAIPAPDPSTDPVPDALLTLYGHPIIVPTVPAPQSRAWAARLPAGAAALVPLLVLGLAAGASALLEHVQPDYYSSLPARVHAERPLFQDSLTQVDYLWPLQVPSASDPASMWYASGGYRLTGAAQSNSMSAWITAEYTDVAVEVTARQVGTGENDGVGLVLSEDDSTGDQLIFAVSPTAGTWWLSHYDSAGDGWDDLQSDTPSAAIHTGDNVSNRLLVIMHGGTYLCYANGQLLGVVSEPANAGVMGHVGVFANNGKTAGVFDDFAVYPAQPASSFFYV